jgi:capsular polysaccharide biosynthesis protein
MELAGAARSKLRRPVALLLVVLVAAVGAGWGWTHTSSTYRSSAAVLVVPASDEQGGADRADNPLTRLDGSIAQLALVVAAQLDADPVRDQVVSAGGDGSYTADTLSNQDASVAQLSPLIRLTATGPTAAGAERAAAVLVAQAADQLAAVQSASNVPVAARAEVVGASAPTVGAVVGNAPARAAGVLGAAGALAALLVLVLLRAARGNPRSDARQLEPPNVQLRTQRPPPAPVRVPAAIGEGRFAQPSAERAPEMPVGTRRRQEVLREMVREDWQRGGSNVPWTRREHRDAYERAEQRLTEMERRRRDFEVEDVRRVDDYLGYRAHG